MSGRVSSSDTVVLAHREHGPRDAPVLVLLHGMGAASDGSSWDPVLPLLGTDHRLIVPDLRGHGSSPRPGHYTIDALAGDVARLLDRLGLTAVTAVGHSLGGLVAIVLAQTRPDLVSALVVEDSPAPPPPAAPPVDTSPPLRAGGPTQYDLDVRPALLRETDRRDPAWARRIGEIRVPALVIGGGQGGVDQDRLAELAARFPAGRMITIDAGHNVHPTSPAEFATAVREFLGRPPRRP